MSRTMCARILPDYGADDVARVRIPVGLDIGARTPAEIALSVLAELVAVRSARRANGGA